MKADLLSHELLLIHTRSPRQLLSADGLQPSAQIDIGERDPPSPELKDSINGCCRGLRMKQETHPKRHQKIKTTGYCPPLPPLPLLAEAQILVSRLIVWSRVGLLDKAVSP